MLLNWNDANAIVLHPVKKHLFQVFPKIFLFTANQTLQRVSGYGICHLSVIWSHFLVTPFWPSSLLFITHTQSAIWHETISRVMQHQVGSVRGQTCGKSDISTVCVPTSSYNHKNIHTYMSTFTLHYLLQVWPCIHKIIYHSHTCCQRHAWLAYNYIYFQTHNCREVGWGGGGLAAGQTGRAADGPTLLDQHQPGSVHNSAPNVSQAHLHTIPFS